MRALSSAWTEYLASDQVVAGSNPAAPIAALLIQDSQYGSRLFINTVGLLTADFNPLRVAPLRRLGLHEIREPVAL